MGHKGTVLKKKATSGVVWTAVQKYSVMGIQFVSGIILARLLTPYDYGCIGMLSIFMVLADTFIDAGFGSALIQKKRPTQEDYSTIFFWNLGMAGVMYLCLFFSAPAISRFYNIPLLCPVLRVNGVVLFLNALNIIQRNQLRKQMNFKKIAIVTTVTSFISLGVTIYLAHKGFGVWALVAQHIITAAIPCLVFWVTNNWFPSFVFSRQSFKELFGFGFYMFLTHLLNNFSGQIQGLLIGKVYNPSTMGYYSKAHSTEKVASNSISGVLTQVTYPLYAEAQDDKHLIANMVKRLTSVLAYWTFPLMFLLLLLAKPIFVLLYTDRWLQSVPYFQVLCLAGLATCLSAVNLQTIPAIGKSRVMLISTVIKRFIGLLAIVGGLAVFGMKGLLAGVVFNSWFSYFVNAWLVSRFVGYRLKDQFFDLLPIMVASVFSAAVAFLARRTFHLGLYVDAVVVLAVYLIVYVGWSLIVKPEAFQYFKSLAGDFIRKRKRNK